MLQKLRELVELVERSSAGSGAHVPRLGDVPIDSIVGADPLDAEVAPVTLRPSLRQAPEVSTNGLHLERVIADVDDDVCVDVPNFPSLEPPAEVGRDRFDAPDSDLHVSERPAPLERANGRAKALVRELEGVVGECPGHDAEDREYRSLHLSVNSAHKSAMSTKTFDAALRAKPIATDPARTMQDVEGSLEVAELDHLAGTSPTWIVVVAVDGVSIPEPLLVRPSLPQPLRFGKDVYRTFYDTGGIRVGRAHELPPLESV